MTLFEILGSALDLGHWCRFGNTVACHGNTSQNFLLVLGVSHSTVQCFDLRDIWDGSGLDGLDLKECQNWSTSIGSTKSASIQLHVKDSTFGTMTLNRKFSAQCLDKPGKKALKLHFHTLDSSHIPF